jgi:drug/metabolite transporter (DMT)-like permease
VSIYEIAALAAATCWAITGVLAATPVAHLGAVAFTRIRMAMVLVMLAVFVATTGSWRGFDSAILPVVAVSGVIGIFLGDAALFLAMSRLGPRRTSILFSTNAPMAVLLGWLVLGEALSNREIAGIACAFAGVILAIVFGKRRSQLHQWEQIRDPLWIGVAVGLFSALCQATGSLILRPAMADGADPATVAMLRVATAVACFYAIYPLFPAFSRAKSPMTGRIAVITALSGFLAMGLGATLLLFALSGGKVGIVSTLSATSPALILPLIWWNTGERPAPAAWIGAAIVVFGTWLISTG